MFSTEMKATCKNSPNLEQETKTTKIIIYPLLSLASSNVSKCMLSVNTLESFGDTSFHRVFWKINCDDHSSLSSITAVQI